MRQLYKITITLAELRHTCLEDQISYCLEESQAVQILRETSEAFLTSLRSRKDIALEHLTVEPGGGGCWLKITYPQHAEVLNGVQYYIWRKCYFDYRVEEALLLDPGESPKFQLSKSPV